MSDLIKILGWLLKSTSKLMLAFAVLCNLLIVKYIVTNFPSYSGPTDIIGEIQSNNEKDTSDDGANQELINFDNILRVKNKLYNEEPDFSKRDSINRVIIKIDRFKKDYFRIKDSLSHDLEGKILRSKVDKYFTEKFLLRDSPVIVNQRPYKHELNHLLEPNIRRRTKRIDSLLKQYYDTFYHENDSILDSIIRPINISGNYTMNWSELRNNHLKNHSSQTNLIKKHQANNKYPDFILNIIDLLIVLAFSALIYILLNYIFLIAHRMDKLSYKEVLRNDKRLPVLYLRAFHNDIKIHDQFSKIGSIYEILKRNGSEEDQLAEALGLVGPVVALNDPTAFISQTGAARKLVENSKWQGEIINIIGESRLIILYFSADSNGNLPKGLEWEIEEVFARAHVQNILLIVKNEYAKLFQKFLPKLRLILAKKRISHFEILEQFSKNALNPKVNKSNNISILGELFWFNSKDELLSDKLVMSYKNDKIIYENEHRKYPTGREWQAMYLYALIPYFRENRIDFRPLLP